MTTNKAAIPGVTINLKSVATGETRSTTSGDDGEYAISSIPPGFVRTLGLDERIRTRSPKHSSSSLTKRDATTQRCGLMRHARMKSKPHSKHTLKKDSASLVRSSTTVRSRACHSMVVTFTNSACSCRALCRLRRAQPDRFAATSRSVSTALVKTPTTSCSTVFTTSIRN